MNFTDSRYFLHIKKKMHKNEKKNQEHLNESRQKRTNNFFSNDIHLNFSIRLFYFLLSTFFLFPFFSSGERGNARGRGDRRDVQRLGTYWDGDQSTRSGDTAGRIFRRVCVLWRVPQFCVF